MKSKELTKIILLLFIICSGFLIHSIPTVQARNGVNIEFSKENLVLEESTTITLKMVKENESYTKTSFKLPSDILNNISKLNTNYVLYDQEKELVTIDWTEIEANSEIQIELNFKDFEEDQFTLKAETSVIDEQPITNEMTITMPKDVSVASEAADNSSENEIISSESDQVIESSTELESTNNSTIPESSSTEEREENSISVNDSSIEDVEDETDEKLEATSQMTQSAISTQSLGAETRSVNNWNNFVSAMEDANVGTINLTGQINKLATIWNNDITVNGNKIINGSSSTKIDFADYNFDIQNYEVTINGLVIEADQDVIINDDNASLFFSDTGGTLNIQNSSFNGTQLGQVAKLPKGIVNIYGSNIFTNEDELEIIEAKNIVFKQNSSFTAGNSKNNSANSDLANVLFLYNNGSIIVEENATVDLFNNNRKTLISVADDSTASINIKDGGQLNLKISEKNAKGNGEPLLYLPGAGSSINMEGSAIFNIENHNTNNPGPLINLNGSISLNSSGSKVELWQSGSDLTQTDGQNYGYLPRVLNGQLTFGTNAIVPDIKNATASPQSTLSISSNTALNNKTFSALMQGMNTQNLNRIQFSGSETIPAPLVNKVTDLDNTISGTTSPGAEITVTDAQNNVYSTTADASTGRFSVSLGPFAPYDYGDTLTITAKDAYHTSSPTNISVTGDRFALRVNDQMAFQQTMISNENITIPRVETDWQVQILNTRGVQNWKLTAHAAVPLSSSTGNHSIDNALIYKEGDVSKSLNSDVLIHQETTDSPGETFLNWEADEGILLQLNPVEKGVQANTEYTGTLNWTLTDAP